MKAKLLKTAALSALLGLGAMAWPVAAHHSTTMFDREKTVQLVGTVKELHWTNPHVAIFIENTSAKAAATGLWVVELTSPGNLARSGWTRSAVKPGDKVVAEVHQLRDGKRGGALRKITLTDTGQSYTFNIRDQERPDIDQDYD